MESRWRKWRLTMESDETYLAAFLEKFSKRESNEDFARRKKISFVAAHAKSNLLEIATSIHQRLVDVERSGGSFHYHNAVKGVAGGVDLCGNSMNSFMGQELLRELLSMRRVGVYIDMPRDLGSSLRDRGNKRPYLYTYKSEDILNWSYVADGKPSDLRAILLKDEVYTLDEETNLPKGTVERLRHLYINDHGTVTVDIYHEDNLLESAELQISRIPFVMLELSDSLLSDVADMQIALTNLDSSDIAYALRSNFPFYVEQYDPAASNQFNIPQDSVTPGDQKTKVTPIDVGTSQGRAIARGLDFPRFIHPSSEPLKASIEKQQILKQDIRQIMNLSMARLQTRRASAESKEMDDRTLDAGLSAIGLEMEFGERQIAEIWAQYEGGEAATVYYPRRWSIKTDDERRKEAAEIKENMVAIPSNTYRREMAKQLVLLTAENKVSRETLAKIIKEIDEAPFIVADPEILDKDIERGLIDLSSASTVKGYPESAVEKAKVEHAERLARIAMAQSNMAARGVPDLSADPGEARKEKEESRNTDKDDVVTDKTRGGAQ